MFFWVHDDEYFEAVDEVMNASDDFNRTKADLERLVAAHEQAGERLGKSLDHLRSLRRDDNESDD